MDQLIIKALLGMFLMTGIFACLNAWAGKWGPSLAMLGMSLTSFAAGLALGGSFLAAIPALLLVAVVGSFRYGRRPSAQPEVVGQDNAQEVSDAMLVEMNRNVAARKGNRG